MNEEDENKFSIDIFMRIAESVSDVKNYDNEIQNAISALAKSLDYIEEILPKLIQQNETDEINFQIQKYYFNKNLLNKLKAQLV